MSEKQVSVGTFLMLAVLFMLVGIGVGTVASWIAGWAS